MLLLGVLASLCMVIGALALSKAFAIGKTAVVAPLVTSYGVFTTLLAWFWGEALSTWQFFGIFTCFFGVLLASSNKTMGGVNIGPEIVHPSLMRCLRQCFMASVSGSRGSLLYTLLDQ
ncbi:hypothetical protein D3C78_1375100 [compost metagenome]